MRYIFALLFAVSLALGQQLDLKSQSRNADFSTHAFIKPWVIGTSLPATCSVGDAFFDSDATAGQNVYVCTATNTWTLSSGAISGLTASRALQSDGSGNVAVSSVTSTELGYLSGVTSAVQTQLNAKQATITGAATTITGSDLTASRAVIANASGKIAVSAVTDTELGYVSGVTSALQTQLNAKLSSTPPGSSGQFIYNNAGAFGAKAIADGDLPSTLADKTLTGPLITASLVANLPSAASNTAKLYVVIDGTAVGDCTTGGGSAATLCRSNGSAWVAFGDGNSGGGGLSPPASSGMLYGTTGGTTTGRTITASTGITVTNGDGVSGNPTVAADTAVMLTRAQAQSGADLLCVPASASGANYTCSMTPALSAYTAGMVVEFKPDVASSAGAVTLNIDSVGSVNVKQSDGATNPGAGGLAAGVQIPLRFDGSVFRMPAASGGGGGGGGAVPGEYSAALDFGSIPDGACEQKTFVATGVLKGAALSLALPSGLNAGLIGMAHASNDDEIAIRLCNLSGGAVDPASMTYKVRDMGGLGFISGSGAIDFGSIADGTCASDTFTVTGAATGDNVAAGFPDGLDAGLVGSMLVSASDTVQVRLCNLSGAAVNPASMTFSAVIQK